MEKTVLAQVTGTVWKIEKGVGTSVVVDDVIMIVESMKMEIPVVASFQGTVMEILVSEGEQVIEGEPLARLST